MHGTMKISFSSVCVCVCITSHLNVELDGTLKCNCVNCLIRCCNVSANVWNVSYVGSKWFDLSVVILSIIFRCRYYGNIRCNNFFRTEHKSEFCLTVQCFSK